VSDTHHVFLIPGFFGFDNLGDVAYFVHVTDALEDFARREGKTLRVRVVGTYPTASLRQRAARLVEQMAEALADAPDGPVHLIGHSVGGLDARLVVTPEVSLPCETRVEPWATRVRTVVSVATPHHGTPVAAFFGSLLGQQLLRVFSLASSYGMRTGRLPLDVVAKLTGMFLRGYVATGAPSATLESLYERLLADFSTGRRFPIEEFVGHISRDQDLLAQITPAAADLFNASAYDRPGVRYASIVTRARVAGVRSFVAAGLSPYAHASHGLYTVVSRLASFMPVDRLPNLTPAQELALRRAYGALPSRRANDGIVPTLSQVWGEVLRAVEADHLDVLGHFDQRTHVPPHFDWLASGSAFDRRHFLPLWWDVARFLFDLPPTR
jgi:triacylglycerol lipase